MKRLSLILLVILIASCSTYYQVNQEFNSRFEQGNLASAESFLKKNKTKRTRFLYYANRGVVNALEGQYEESNKWFEKAYIYSEDYAKDPAAVAASFLVNPQVVPYQAEDHEQLLILYYKALNYLKLNDYEAALVECRRLNVRLNQLSDKYKSDNKYRRDAFIHNLMGIIYEASGDVNNAFIAYRNAYEIYESDYEKLFGLGPPTQLKQDLLRTAYLNGFMTELYQYEDEFGMSYQPVQTDANLIFFWHNGLGPVKGEWSLNFAVQGGDGAMAFASTDEGMSFPIPINSLSDEQSNALADLKVFRVAFPKYIERPVSFAGAYLEKEGSTFDLELAEDVNDIAFKTLQERMLKELGKGILRVALKKAAEKQLRKESDGWGAVMGIVNAVTEKADTRNWQTIPHSIYYSRIPLDIGKNELVLKTFNVKANQPVEEVFTYDVDQKGVTLFQVYQSF
ncbi:COG3014 family protein [Marinoscillum sp. MHG1-6]|uniref:COG3014 family protein n=1 Tax=Marinoscillum sp. MHG1-6 TaxID=2959627 RepID=UPI00215839B6|nr:hypothetical protein [Marinoscillum sp. MHG1-6]